MPLDAGAKTSEVDSRGRARACGAARAVAGVPWRCRGVTSRLLLAAAWFLVAGACTPEQTANESSTSRTASRADSPDSRLVNFESVQDRFPGGVSRLVCGNYHDRRRLTLMWLFIPRDRLIARAEQSFSLDFDAQQVVVLDRDAVCLFGRRSDGSHTLVLWRFADVAADGSPAPRYLGEERWSLPRRESVSLIWYEHPDGPRGGVLARCVTRSGPRQRVLLWFDRSRELVLFDLDGGAERIVADPKTVPELAGEYDGLLAADTDRGVAYLLLQRDALDGRFRPILALDADRDGVPESVRAFDRDTFRTEGWDDRCPYYLPSDD